ncbi:MAG TPA: glycosyltransferase [Gaiellaceae bacterium]|nr:glycosyltransferase [Gaiellaceae bacterium]
MQAVRIVHLVIGGDVAGGQLVALQLAQAARERGDTVSFVVPAEGGFVDRARAEGFDAAIVDAGRTYRLRGVLRLAQLLREQRADVLHTHTLAGANVTSRVAARLAGVAVVSHLHIANSFRPSTRFALRRLDNWTARLAAALVAVSEDTRRAYVEQGYPTRMRVVHNGVETASASANGLREELAIPADAPLVVEVGRLCDVKGQRELIEAVAQVDGARAILVGADLEQEGAYERVLRRRAEELGVAERVVFAGARDDAARVLAAADVVALPSWTEGLPMVVLEAMALGRAVVATPVGGTPELLEDGETGLLVPPRDPKALATALRRLLEDDALRRRLGDNARRRVDERFTADATAREVLAIYDEVVR